jgi:hypothetical protein
MMPSYLLMLVDAVKRGDGLSLPPGNNLNLCYIFLNSFCLS